MSAIEVRAYRLSQDGAVSATGIAASAIDPSWSEVLSEPGSGSVTFKNTDPILATLGFDGRDLLQFRIDGVPEWVMWPDPAKIVSISQQEGDGERTTLSGPGHLALIDRMRVYPGGDFTDGIGPMPKLNDRFYNWTTPLFDISGMDPAKEIMDVGTAKVSWPDPWADDFPLDICEIIWADNPLGNTSTSAEADEGTCWFWYDFTAPEDGLYRMFVATDNAGDCYIDSLLVLTSDSFKSTQQADFTMSAGPHRLAMRVHNGSPFPGLDSGPGGVSLAIALVTLAGPTLLLYTFDGFSVLAYEDDPPGVTPGYAYGLFVSEGQARGVLPDLVPDFTDTLDTNGNAWDEVADISTSVNTSGLDFTRQLAGTYIDVAMDPDLSAGLVLHAYRLGEMGGVSGVTCTRGVNVTSQEHQRENQPVTDLLIEGADRWMERGDSASRTAYGRFESGLDAGAPASSAEVFRIADGQLDVYAHPREEISLNLKGVSTVIRVGDTAIVTDSTGTSQAERCVGRTVTQDGLVAILTYSFRDVILGETERIVNIAKAGR